MRISSCNSMAVQVTKNFQDVILELESPLLMMTSQVKSISKRANLYKLTPKHQFVKFILREEMEVMVLLLLITLHLN